MTTDIAIALANAEDLASVAELVVDMGADPGTHCIHSWAGESVSEVARELGSTFDDGELTYVLARRGPALAGAMGCEFDTELGRGWLQGPHIRGDRGDVGIWLFDTLQSALPYGIRELDAFLNEANADGRQFYRDQGFRERDTRFHEYQMLRGSQPTDTDANTGATNSRDTGTDTGPTPLTQTHHATFISLFDALFPNTYYSHERLLEMQGDSHEILVTAEGERVVGFVVAYRARGHHRGEIQFLGVCEDRRGQGIGRQLIQAGIGCLHRDGVSEISLNVEDAKAGARRLYRSVGFELRYTGVALKRRTPMLEDRGGGSH